MSLSELTKQVEALLKKSAKATDSGEALRFAEAAQRAASAIAQIQVVNAVKR